MKTILVLFFLLVSYFSFGQLTNQVPQGNVNTETYDVGIRGFGLGSHYRTSWTDTASLNSYCSGCLKSIAGFRARIVNDIWQRSNDFQSWIKQGTAFSVGLSLPSIFTVSGSPVTTSGTLTGTLNTQSANRVFAGPTSGGAATPTFRALVAADIAGLSTNIYNTDGTLTGDRTLSGAVHDLLFDNVNSFVVNSYLGSITGSLRVDPSSSFISMQNGGKVTNFNVFPDSIRFQPYLGQMNIDTLKLAASSTNRNLMTWNTTNGAWEQIAPTSIVTNPAISSLTAAAATNSIDNTNYQQEWSWNSLTNNTGLSLVSNSTTAASNNQVLFESHVFGANSTSTQTTKSAWVINNHTGTSSTNIALQLEARSGTNNYALIVPASNGSVGIGTLTPSAQFHNVGTTRFDLGSDATGDMYYRAATTGLLTKLTVGTAGQHLLGGTIPHWSDTATAGGGTPSLTATQIAFGDGSNLMTSSSDLTWDGSVYFINGKLLAGQSAAIIETDISRGIVKIGDIALAANGNVIWNDDQNSKAYYNNTAHNGKFGINTSSPIVAADIVGDINVHGTNGSGLKTLADNTTIGDVFGGFNSTTLNVDDNTETLTIMAALQTTTNSAGVRFSSYTAGAATFDGSGNITSVSDRRAKHGIKSFTYGLDAILKLRTSSFIYNQDSSNTLMSGFIAQDVQKVIPIAVHQPKQKDGMLSLETNAILAASVNAIRELKELNDKQQKEIDILKAKIKLLKK